MYEPGQVLFNKGDKADHLAIILEGEVEIFDPADNKTIAVLGHGASFGEQAILEGGVRGVAVMIDGHTITYTVRYRIEAGPPQTAEGEIQLRNGRGK